MPSISDLRIVQDGRAQIVIVLGRYGNEVRSLLVDDAVDDKEGRRGFEDGVWLEVEVEDCDRTWIFRGALGLEPPIAADAEANMVAVSLDHFSYIACAAASGFASAAVGK